MVETADPDRYEGLTQPIIAVGYDYPSGHVIDTHAHRRAQLVHAVSGVMAVVTPEGRWIVPSHRAVWVPAGLEHAVRMSGCVRMRSLYVSVDATTGLPSACRGIEVSPLLRALVQEAARLPLDYQPDSRAGRIMALIIDEIRSTQALPLHLPLPRDERLMRVCRRVQADPGLGLSLDQAARLAGLSRRAFTRLFRHEAGMSFAPWVRRARLLEALPRLALGQSVTTVALDLGYDSPSAFSAMVRRMLGTAPTAYLASAAGPVS